MLIVLQHTKNREAALIVYIIFAKKQKKDHVSDQWCYIIPAMYFTCAMRVHFTAYNCYQNYFLPDCWDLTKKTSFIKPQPV